MRVVRNGIDSKTLQRQKRLNPAAHASGALAAFKPSGKPIGRAPADFTRPQVLVWNRLVRELRWLDGSHRAWLAEAARTVSRLETIHAYFDRKEAELREAGHDPALASLDDNGRRHPLAVERKGLSDSMQKLLMALGANPAVQARLAAQMAGAQESAPGGDTSRFLA